MAHSGVFAVVAFVLGTIVGSFLNACIYRLPRNISLDKPRRSFCPHCQVMIPWYYNLPIISWLWLRGRCAKCGAPISPRYLLVELLTGFAFLGLWLEFHLPLAPVYALFVALLIVATFIDFEHYIIPDEITLGGAAAGIVCSALVPSLMGVTEHWKGAVLSLLAAVLGTAVLWIVVEFGKLAFGRKRFTPESGESEAFTFEPDPEDPKLVLGDESLPWSEIFFRKTDELILECRQATLNGKTVAGDKICVFHDHILVGEKSVPIEEVRALAGKWTAVVIPREAMGFGDVKFLACIGAFLGWQAIFFTLVMSSVIGAIVGGGLMLVTRGKEGGRIPYGPYLALGAVAWVAFGPETVRWYLHLLHGTPR
jgi:leader peptidase (prepilin peptidase)/N-methyltransferase